MNAYKTEVTFSEDGELSLKGLPFHAGDAVEVIILERPGKREAPVSNDMHQEDFSPLAGSVIQYDDPFAPAVLAEDWDVIQ